MEDILIQVLETFGYPVRLQGSLGEDEEYPDHFFTFWNSDTYDKSHYDNKRHGVIWDFDVNFYSIDPSLTYSVLTEARTKLENAGFIITGNGYSVPSDVPTHTGRGMNPIFMET